MNSNHNRDSSLGHTERDMDAFFRDHQKLFDKMRSSFFDDQDFFSSPFNSDDFSFSRGGHLSLKWSESNKGRTLVIENKKKNQNLDVKIDKNLISIKTKSEESEEGFSSFSQFSQTTTVPQDCDASKVEVKELENGSLEVFFPYFSKKKKKRNKRFPISPSKEDLEI